ncbi:eliciting plant response-like protein [Ophiocordyceps camponoti-floridani]|uniref:Eliciting plant response-like protein n=1 Tax=Ophiocordyceps camponoti-floridani TaxID=2030778 RepID=A0A8H4VFT5_9HYPO|nr:eliciting plant response-like protein [Ophiocordyceps camponoti-floridani]
MHLISYLSQALLVAVASATQVSFDAGYDDASRSLNSVSCSDGANGLMTRYHWQTQGQIPGFPYIGGAQGVTWNSPRCGSCYSIAYRGREIRLLAIDASYNGGFNIGLRAMDFLTDGNGKQFGHIEASTREVPPAECFLR